jgi:hypothetical protein
VGVLVGGYGSLAYFGVIGCYFIDVSWVFFHDGGRFGLREKTNGNRRNKLKQIRESKEDKESKEETFLI